MQSVFISGATGYLGRTLTEDLIASGRNVHALARPQSIRRLPAGCQPVPGDALKEDTFAGSVPRHCTFIHLTGVAKPSPAKGPQFRAIDQVSFRASLRAAVAAEVRHFVYVSVAQPAPIMREYIAVRKECEAELAASGLCATILRPWYVLGPGHRWPLALVPFYWAAKRIPSWCEPADRLGLVSHREMVAALFRVVLFGGTGQTILDVPAIRRLSRATPAAASASP